MLALKTNEIFTGGDVFIIFFVIQVQIVLLGWGSALWNVNLVC